MSRVPPPAAGLRICIVTQYFWPENFRINDLVQALVDRGNLVQVLTGLPNYPSGKVAPGFKTIKPKRSEVFGSTVVRVPLIPRGKGSGLRLALNYLSFAASATLVGVRAMRKPADVILVYEPSPVTVAIPALALGKRLDAPVLMWVQDLWPETLRATGVLSEGSALRAAGWLTGRLHRAMDGLLVQTRAFGPLLVNQGVTPAKITYLPNWAEDNFRPTTVPPTAPERLELPKGFVVLFAGNIGVAQGLDVLLGAAERLRQVEDLHWVVLGDGRQAGWLRHEIERRGLNNVHFLGSRPSESMPTWFALADALLVTLKPDPIYKLTIPSKIQAYLACGRPLLASLDGVGAQEVQDAGAGLASPAGDVEALAEITRSLYHLPAQERAAMGERARTHYDRNFNREMLIDRIEKLLRNAATARLNERAMA
jgi:glycosyltransferase involved in cell wall biosynthesis